MAQKYTEYKGLNLPLIQAEVLRQWEEGAVFEQSVAARDGAPPFVFYEGPPSANGLPGIHHVMSRTLKDLVCRYKTMQGYKVARKAGWDTHGLPIELGVEKELGITKEDIGTKISVADYNRKCREAVMRYKAQWDELTTQIGYWVDLDDPYVTFENAYIETLWWCLKQLFDKNLLYKSVSIQPYSPAAGTGLSSHELNQPGTYKNVKDTTVVALFRAEKAPLFSAAGELPVHLLAWTTTPWTLPANLGLTVGPNINYVLIRTFNPYTAEPIAVVLAEALVPKYFKEEGKEGDFASYNKEEKTLPWEVLARFKGKELEDLRYEQLMPYEGNTAEIAGGDPFRVVTGDFVTTEDGTGIVHTAPAFGADDYKVGQKANLGILTLVDRQGRFVEGLGELSGRYVKNYTDDPEHKEIDVDIAVALKGSGKAFKVEKYEHSYPHCWRTDKPILYYPLDAWFIRTTAAKERMIALNKTVQWKPAATGEGRFGNWLENMVDWNLSRSRYWGTPLPVWTGRSKGNVAPPDENYDAYNVTPYVAGSKKDLIGNEKTKGYYFSEKSKFVIDGLDINSDLNQKLKNLLGTSVPTDADLFWKISPAGLRILLEHRGDEVLPRELLNIGMTFELLEPYLIPMDSAVCEDLDLHKPYIDNVIFREENGEFFLCREPDLIDVWFDSGAMPYAQWHYPFENKEKIEAGEAFPADFIAEGVDQTRGWFYTLHALGVLLFDSVAYKTVVSNGLVLDKNGAKMSKRLGNTVNPFETVAQYGADATRWYMITAASPWDNLRFDSAGISEVQRKFFGTLFNTYQFFALYANVDGFSTDAPQIPHGARPESDRWILSALNTLIQKVTAAYNDYEPTAAGRAVEVFLDEHLSNWYVRLNRRRFWKGSYNEDKISAYQTLHRCLTVLAQLIAPIAPFFADWLWKSLSAGDVAVATSVHLTDFPVADTALIDAELEARTVIAQDLSSLILSIRKKEALKVRQPLQKALIPVLDAHMKAQIEAVEELVKAEVNVKEFQYLSADDNRIQKRLKPNFKALGARLGGAMKEAAALLTQLPTSEINKLETDGFYELSLAGGGTARINLEDVAVLAEDVPGWSVAYKGNLTASLDITLSKELIEEGHARELVNRIQKLRKDEGFNLTDRIRVMLTPLEPLEGVLENFGDYIKSEVLADELLLRSELETGTEIEVAEAPLKVLILKSS